MPPRQPFWTPPPSAERPAQKRFSGTPPPLQGGAVGAATTLAALAGALALLAMSPQASAEDAAPVDAPSKLGAPLAGEKSKASFELTVEVGGAPMSPSKTIIENAADSRDHTRFVAEAEAAGLAETLAAAGPFTLFAPVNKAFQNLPKDISEQLSQPANDAFLRQVLSYHVLPGKYSAADFIAAIKAGGGKAMYKTLEGDELSLLQDGRRLEIIDARGRKAIVTISDVNQKNGVIHVIDAVLLPKS